MFLVCTSRAPGRFEEGVKYPRIYTYPFDYLGGVLSLVFFFFFLLRASTKRKKKKERKESSETETERDREREKRGENREVGEKTRRRDHKVAGRVRMERASLSCRAGADKERGKKGLDEDRHRDEEQDAPHDASSQKGRSRVCTAVDALLRVAPREKASRWKKIRSFLRALSNV